MKPYDLFHEAAKTLSARGRDYDNNQGEHSGAAVAVAYAALKSEALARTTMPRADGDR